MPNAVVLGTAHPHIFGIAAHAAQIPGVKLVGVYDEDPARRAAAAERLKLPALATLEAALANDVKLTLIGAVPSQRAHLAARSVAAGAAVLADKPLALTPEALQEVIDAVERHGKPVSVYYPYRGHSHVLAARAALQAGRIGQLVRVFSCGPHKLNAPTRPDWHWSAEHNGGIFIDIGSHHLDLCCWLAGGTPQWLSALGGNRTMPQHPGFQDFGQAQLRFPNGVFGHVEVDWLNPTKMKNFGDTRVWLQGTTGKIELRLGDEVSAKIWNDQVAGEDLDVAAHALEPSWDHQLFAALLRGEVGPIPQAEIWRASRVSIAAQRCAASGGVPLTAL